MKKSKNNISDWLDKHSNPEIDKLVEQQAKEIMGQYNIEYQYLDLLQDILDNGVEKRDRTGTGTLSVFGRQIRHKMSEGYPLLTTKKMAFKTMTTELIWFLRGDTNIKYLVDNNCHIWDGDAYKAYCKSRPQHNNSDYKKVGPREISHLPVDEFINKIKTDEEFAKKWGDLGPIYGKQWRSWSHTSLAERKRTGSGLENPIDQIKNSIELLKTDPDSRRNIVSSWNVGELDQMTLPPCHYGFQVYTRELTTEERFAYFNKINKVTMNHHKLSEHVLNNTPTRAISLMWNQRSVDTFLGLPFNITSYATLLEIIAKEVNMIPDELIGNLGDVHLYKNHLEQAKEQLTREPFDLPTLNIANAVKWKSGDCLPYYSPNDFTLKNYRSHPAIKAPLSN